MQVKLPHTVIYDTGPTVPIADVIESLRGAVQLSEEIGPLLESLFPGLTIELLTLEVREISQASPLREALAFAIVAQYQDVLATEMPEFLRNVFGIDVPQHYDGIVSVLFLIVAFYSVEFMFRNIGKLAEIPRTNAQLSSLIAEFAVAAGKTEDEIRASLESKFKRNNLKGLLSASLKFLSPGKNQDNSKVIVGGRTIAHEVMAEIPGPAQVKAEEQEPKSKSIENVEILLHAQDIDHGKQGWAAVVPVLSDDRIKMQLYPPITPADIYLKEVIRGDILVESIINDKGDEKPIRIHLIRLREG